MEHHSLNDLVLFRQLWVGDAIVSMTISSSACGQYLRLVCGWDCSGGNVFGDGDLYNFNKVVGAQTTSTTPAVSMLCFKT